MLTGFDRKEAEKKKQLIESLGGKWEPAASNKTTHVVSAGFFFLFLSFFFFSFFSFFLSFLFDHLLKSFPFRKLTRTEKIVSGLAMGAWVLNGEFLAKVQEV